MCNIFLANSGRCSLAISTSQFEPEAYAANVERSKADGLYTESHADSFERFDMINNADIDYVSTDFLAPDWYGQGEVILHRKGSDNAQALEISTACKETSEVPFGAIYLEMDFCGSTKVKLAGQEFTVSSSGERKIRHQVLLSDALPQFELTEMSDDFKVNKIMIRVVKF